METDLIIISVSELENIIQVVNYSKGCNANELKSPDSHCNTEGCDACRWGELRKHIQELMATSPRLTLDPKFIDPSVIPQLQELPDAINCRREPHE